MTQSGVIGVCASGGVTVASTTYFTSPNSSGFVDFIITTEASVLTKFRGPTATVKNFNAQVQTNSGTWTGNHTVKLRTNGADSSLVISITAGVTGRFTDLTHSATVNDGDTWAFSLLTGTGSGSLWLVGLTAEAQQSTQSTQMLTNSMVPATSLSGGGFFALGGGSGRTGAETNIYTKALEAITLSNMQIIISTADTSTMTFNSRVNQSNGNQVIAAGASTTGFFEDTTHSDSVSSGGTYGMAYTITSSAGATAWGMKYKGGTAATVYLPGQLFGTAVTTTTRYVNIPGDGFSSAETQSQALAPVVITLSKLTLLTPVNASASTMTVNQRVNGANGNQTITVAAGVTGFFQDLTHTDTVPAANTFDISFSGAGSGGVNLWTIGELSSGPVTITSSGLLLFGVG